jgi:4-hydroxy-tetrahydrodipicolinate synthase
MPSTDQFGLSCALALPFEDDSTIDHGRLAEQARWCLEAGCSSVTVFGTTGEGASVSLAERSGVLATLLSAGVEPTRQLVGGVSAVSIGDAAEQIRILNDVGCQRILLPPPFYFKGVSDEGLYGWFARVGESVAHCSIRIILYHIPSVTQVPLTSDLIRRLKIGYPGLIMGVKDSGGDFAFTEALLEDHGDLTILVGDERHLAAGVRLGAAGAISGLANFCPAELLPLMELGTNDPQIIGIVNEILKYPVTPAIKALLAYRRNDARWSIVRPPLTRISPQDSQVLAAAYDRIFGQELNGLR